MAQKREQEAIKEAAFQKARAAKMTVNDAVQMVRKQIHQVRPQRKAGFLS